MLAENVTYYYCCLQSLWLHLHTVSVWMMGVAPPEHEVVVLLPNVQYHPHLSLHTCSLPRLGKVCVMQGAASLALRSLLYR